MLYVDMLTTAGDWAWLTSSFAVMTWISSWHGSDMSRQQWVAKLCHSSGVLCLKGLQSLSK